MSMLQQQSHPLMQNLLHMVRKNPDVRTCIQRVSNACMAGDIQIRENQRPVAALLAKVIQQHYRQFLHNALEMSYVCGFCAFHVRRDNDIPLPYVLPLGSFTWSVEVSEPHSKKRKYEDHTPFCKYRVRMLYGNIKESDIHIVNFEAPMLTGPAQKQHDHLDDAFLRLQTPLAHILEKFEIVRTCMRVVFECNKWNINKHLVVTENLELKDQTTSGIQLLDEFRRYSLTGTHSMMREGILKLRTRENKDLGTVNDAAMHWMHDQFSDEKDAKVHMMPPNMQIQELKNIDYGKDLQFFAEDFLTAVYAFFDLPRTKEVAGSKTSASGEIMSRQQHLNILHTCKYLEHVAAVAYAVCFHTDVRNIEFNIIPQNRLDINSAADVKALCDANVFPEGQRGQLKNLYNIAGK